MNLIHLQLFKNRYVLLAFGLLFICILYLPQLPAEFFNVDDIELTKIPQITNNLNLSSIKSILNPLNHIDYYPVRDFSYLIDTHLGNGEPISFRVHQLTLFICSVTVLFLILNNIGIPHIASTLLAIAWGVQPVHIEMVSWISARKDMLAIFFILLSVLFFMKYLKSKNKIYLDIYIIFYILSIFSKASFALLPFFVFYYLYLFNFNELKNKIHLYLIGASVGYSLFQSWFYQNVNNVSIDISFKERLLSSLAALGKVVAGWLYWPLNVVDVENLGHWYAQNSAFIYLGAMLWAILLFSTFYYRKNKKIILFVFGLLLLYLPVSGLIFSHKNFYSVRYLEPTHLFLWLSFIYLLKSNKRAFSKLMLLMGALGIVGAMGTYKDIENWGSSLDIRRKAFKQNSGSVSLAAQYYAEFINKKNTKKILSDEESRVFLHLKNTLEQKCSKTKVENFETCLRYFYIQYVSVGDKDSYDQFIYALEKQNRLQSLRLFNLEYALKSHLDVPLYLRRYAENTHYYPSPKARFNHWIAKCLLASPHESQNYMQSLIQKNLINVPQFKWEVSQLHAEIKSKVQNCL